MRIVVALGGNALLRRDERAEADIQRTRVRDAASALAAIAADHQLVVTHGNGPQVGLLALEAAAYPDVEPYPLDILGAESQGMIGYLLAQALTSETPSPVATILTQVVVDPDDPAFGEPTKPIGPVYREDEAAALADAHGWSLIADGPYLRRVVPSPRPHAIVELAAIRRLVETGHVVVCAGGGGIPVVASQGRLSGVEAVIDKDLTAALLAEELGAHRLVIATDVPAVERDWGRPSQRPIDRATPSQLRALTFATGSMAPKVDAACTFAERTGRPAVIGSLDDLAALAEGSAGTIVAQPLGHPRPRRKEQAPGLRGPRPAASPDFRPEEGRREEVR